MSEREQEALPDMLRMGVCPACNGIGGEEHHRCYMCGGRGEVEYVPKIEYEGTWELMHKSSDELSNLKAHIMTATIDMLHQEYIRWFEMLQAMAMPDDEPDIDDLPF